MPLEKHSRISMMAQRGGARPGAGRKAGKVGAAKRQLSEMAKEHAMMALETLADIARSGEGEAARVSAANAILDRAYGKPAQSMEVTSPDGSMSPKPAFDLSKLSTGALAEIMAASDEASKQG